MSQITVVHIRISSVREVLREIISDERGGPFGISDQLLGMMIGMSLVVAGVAGSALPQAFANTTVCSNNLQEIDLAVREATIATGAVPGNGGSISITDASLSAYLPVAYTDPSAPAGSNYTVQDTSDTTNDNHTWLITCPGIHMGVTTLRWSGGALTKHTLTWDSQKQIIVI